MVLDKGKGICDNETHRKASKPSDLNITASE